MTFEELERGMKLLFDQQVRFADDLGKLEERQARLEETQEKSAQQIAELTASEITVMRAITSIAATVGDIAEAQKRTDATVAVLAEDLQILTRRIDAFIAALRDGHEKSK